MHFGIKPKFRFYIYNFRETEKIEIPPEYIETFEYSDSLDGGNFSLTFPGGGTKKLYSKQRYREYGYLRELLGVGNVIHITESDTRIFTGYIKSVRDSINMDGGDTMIVSGGGIEDFIKTQPLFVDVSEISNYLSKHLSIVGESTRGMKTPGEVVFAILSGAIDYASTRGGKTLYELMSISNKSVSKFAYFSNLISAPNMYSGDASGNTFNYWDLASGYAKVPLYELFVHHTEDQIYRDNTTAGVGTMYLDPSIGKDYLSHVVFRPTPFEYLITNTSSEYLVVEVNQSRFDRVNLTDNLTDLFTGISLIPPFESQKTAGLISRTLYDEENVQVFGQRVLNISIDGYSARTKGDTSYHAELISLQKSLFETFGDGERRVSGTFSGDYFRGICKGKFIDIVDDDNDTKNLNPHLKRYENRFYVKGISVNANIASGEASMDIEVQWGKWKRGGEGFGI